MESVPYWLGDAMRASDYRLRLCCRKQGRLRFLSHLEYTHAIERGIRRANLPYVVTQGFNPRMKLSFAPALPVGTIGLREYVDLWLRQYIPAEQVISALSLAMPPEIAPEEARYVSSTEKSLAAQCTIALYEVILGGDIETQADLENALVQIVNEGELRIEQKGKTKVFDLSHALPKEIVVRSSGSDTLVLSVVIRMGQEGSLRPDSLVTAALSRFSGRSVIQSVTRLDTLVELDSGELKAPI